MKFFNLFGFRKNQNNTEVIVKESKVDKNYREVSPGHYVRRGMRYEDSEEYRREVNIYPKVYSFLTIELEAELKGRGVPIGIVNHGYHKLCECEHELNETKEIYKKGELYKGETISAFNITLEKNMV